LALLLYNFSCNTYKRRIIEELLIFFDSPLPLILKAEANRQQITTRQTENSRKWRVLKRFPKSSPKAKRRLKKKLQ
jgi:hypothetical protein